MRAEWSVQPFAIPERRGRSVRRGADPRAFDSVAGARPGGTTSRHEGPGCAPNFRGPDRWGE